MQNASMITGRSKAYLAATNSKKTKEVIMKKFLIAVVLSGALGLCLCWPRSKRECPCRKACR